MAAGGSVKIGIIGGTGLDDPDILEGRTEKYVDTPYGKIQLSANLDSYADLLSGKLNNFTGLPYL